MKKFIFLGLLLLILISGCASLDGNSNDSTETIDISNETKCNFEEYKEIISFDESKEKSCKLSFDGFIYNEETEECSHWGRNSCGNPYPFQTIGECEQTCISNTNKVNVNNNVYEKLKINSSVMVDIVINENGNLSSYNEKGKFYSPFYIDKISKQNKVITILNNIDSDIVWKSMYGYGIIVKVDKKQLVILRNNSEHIKEINLASLGLAENIFPYNGIKKTDKKAIKNVEFSYNINITNINLVNLSNLNYERYDLEERDYTLGMLDKPNYYRDIENVIIDGNKVTINKIFQTPSSCTNLNYNVEKEGQIIKIIPSISEIQDDAICPIALGADYVQINMTLSEGNYDVVFYDVWENKPFANETFSIFANIPKYDKDLLDVFKKEGPVEIILVRGDGNIDDIISTLNVSDYTMLRKYDPDFAAIITKQGFNKLVSNQQVREIITISPIKKPKEINLEIDKEYEFNKVHSLTFDGNGFWGINSSNALLVMNEPFVKASSSCNLPFDGRGVEYQNNNLWVVSYASLKGEKVYRISPEKCKSEEQCTEENGCIISYWNIAGSHYPGGITSDGNYLFILEQNYKIELVNSVILKFDFEGNLVNYFIAPNEILGDIVWDGKYFWIIGSNGYLCAGFCDNLPPDYFKIYQYDKDFNLVSESNKFEKATLDHFGIAYDGNNLWVSDRYNDKIYKIREHT